MIAGFLVLNLSCSTATGRTPHSTLKPDHPHGCRQRTKNQTATRRKFSGKPNEKWRVKGELRLPPKLNGEADHNILKPLYYWQNAINLPAEIPPWRKARIELCRIAENQTPHAPEPLEKIANLDLQLPAFEKESEDKGRPKTNASFLIRRRGTLSEAVRHHWWWKSTIANSGMLVTSISYPHVDYLDVSVPRRRPYGYWRDFHNLRIELLDFMAVEKTASERKTANWCGGFLPSTGQLKAARRSDLVHGIYIHGGFKRVAQLLNFRVRYHSRTYWKRFENVENALLQFIDEFGEPGVMPSTALLDGCAPPGLAGAIVRLHGGSMAVARRMGLRYLHPRRPRGYWSRRENRVAELKSFMIQLRELNPMRDRTLMPTSSEMMQMGKRDLANALFRYEGFSGMADSLGLRLNGKSRKPHGYWKTTENISAELRAFAQKTEQPWRMPTQAELIAEGRADIAGAVLRYGTWKSAAENAGLELRTR